MLGQNPTRFSLHIQRSRSPRIRGRVLFAGAGVAGAVERLEGGDEVVFAVAYEVGAAHGFQGFAQQRPVVGIVVAQKGFVQAAAFVASDDVYRFTVAGDFAQRVFVGVVHRRGGGHGRGVEGLHLVGAEAVFLQPNG